MQGQEDIVSRFSSFLNFKEMRGCLVPSWNSDPHLERNMRRLVDVDRNAIEGYWARYFLKILQGSLEGGSSAKQHYAKGHLTAYLQQICDRVAKKLSYQHRRVEFLQQRYSYQDYFQLASEAASDPANLLKKFRLNSSSTLSAYAMAVLKGKAQDAILRRNKEISWQKDGDWGVLRKVSRREIEASLNARRLHAEVERSLLIWQWFKAIYVPTVPDGSRTLAAPTSGELNQIAKGYNQHRFGLSEPGKAMTEDDVSERLETIVQAVRDRSTIWFSYPDRKRQANGLETGDFWDSITPESAAISPDEPLALIADKDEQLEIESTLSNAFSELTDEAKILLRLWEPGLGLTQAEMGQVFNRKQYQISRQLTRCRRSLLRAFAREIEKDMNLTLDNDRLAMVQAPMEECLGKQCQLFLYKVLAAALQTIPANERNTLVSYIQGQPAESGVAESGVVETHFAAARQSLQVAFTHTLATECKLPVGALNAVAEPIATFIENGFRDVANLNDEEIMG